MMIYFRILFTMALSLLRLSNANLSPNRHTFYRMKFDVRFKLAPNVLLDHIRWVKRLYSKFIANVLLYDV